MTPDADGGVGVSAPLVKLQTALSRHTRENDRNLVLESLRSSRCLSFIPLDPSQPGEISAALSEVAKERVILNGVSFLRGAARFGGGEDFLIMLREVCDKLCESEGILCHPRAVYDGIVTRMARTASAADSYFKLNSLLGSPDLMLMPTQAVTTVLPPIELDVFASAGCIHASFSTANVYGLYRKADLKDFATLQADINAGTNRPWISIEAIVEERVNFGNGESVRYLNVKIPEINESSTQ